MIYAAILAGGSGLRMGGNLPKQFLNILGRPVIIRSIDAFVNSGKIDMIYVAVSEDYLEYTQKLISEYIQFENIKVICGGCNRNETLYNVLESIKESGKISDNDIILTHDAVRPFIDNRIISENIEAVKKYGAGNTVIPAVDTILQSSEGKFIDSIPLRSTMFHGQTPQSFSVKKITEFYENMTPEEFERYTDACSVFVAKGEKVCLVKGSRNNIKLTYPEDIEKAESIIKSKEQSE